MSKIIIYWTGTGNTESIANKLAEDLGIEARNVDSITVDEALSYDLVIFGCPAMGAEELEDSTFRPFYDEYKSKKENARVALFGSYDWGDGEWLRLWEAEAKETGEEVLGTLKVNGDISVADTSEYDAFVKAL
jgi:flavodoxin short chain